MNNKLDNQQMFLDNEKLIYFTMKKYFPHIFKNLDTREEYYQIGAIGLLKAINKYNSNIAAFSTYAISIIWGEMKRNIRDHSNTIHFSRKIIDIANNLIYAYNESEHDNEDYENWIEKSIRELDISEHDKIGVRNYILKPIALETQDTEDNKLTFGDRLASKVNVIDDIEYNDYMFNIANKLNNRDKRVFYELLNDSTQIEIASKIGVSQAQISRIQRKIKMYAIKELWNIGQFDTALDKIYDIYSNGKGISNDDLIKICHNYQIDLSKCPQYLIEKRIKPMQKNETKIYSKKSCQKLILKCVMKLLLSNKEPQDNNNFKQSVEHLLIKNNYNNESIFKHLQSMVTSQIKSCIDLAKKTIEKYNYKREYEIVVDELDFKTSKFIKQEIKSYSLQNTVKTSSNDNIINSIINLLEQFRRDNLMVRF